MRLKFEYPKGAFRREFDKHYKAIAAAATGAIQDAAAEVSSKGAANIASAGFSPRWQKGLRTYVVPSQPATPNPFVHVYHRYGFASVFETGAVIAGKKGLLWLSLPTIPDKVGGHPMSPKWFTQLIGPLHTIKAPGKPPLLGAYMQGIAGSKVTVAKLRRGQALAKLGVRSRRGAYGARGVVSVPVFVGLSSVTIRRRWNLTQVYATAVRNLEPNYSRRLAELER